MIRQQAERLVRQATRKGIPAFASTVGGRRKGRWVVCIGSTPMRFFSVGPARRLIRTGEISMEHPDKNKTRVPVRPRLSSGVASSQSDALRRRRGSCSTNS